MSPLVPRAALIGVVLVLLAASDMAVGAKFPPPSINDSLYMPHPTLGWCMRRRTTGSAGALHVSSNSLGYRGDEVSSTKPEGEIRVLCVGDSVAFGWAVRDGKTWIEVAQSGLAGRLSGQTVRMINAGVSGYATWQEVGVVRELSGPVQADCVVLQFCFNDVLDMSNVQHGMMSGSQQQFMTVDSSHWSGWVRAVQTTIERRRAEQLRRQHLWAGKSTFDDFGREGDRGYALYAEPPPAAIMRGWEHCFKSLDDLRTFCDDRKLGLIVMFIPVKAQLEPDGITLNPQRHLADWASKSGVDFLDLTDDMRRIAAGRPGGNEWLMADDVHPSEPGSQVIGELLASHLGRRLSNP